MALKTYYVYMGNPEKTIYPVLATSLAHAKEIYARKMGTTGDNPYIRYKTKDIPTYRKNLPPLVDAKETDIKTPDIEHRRKDYAQKKEDRISRFEELAKKKEREATSLIQDARKMASVIPFGQPILVGHHSEKADRSYRGRIDSKYEKGFETAKKAEYYAERAKTASDDTTISSDDPDAIQKLEEKLKTLETRQEQFKQINKIVKSKRKGYPQEQKVSDLMKTVGLSEATALKVFEPDFAGRVGIADYQLTNNNANMKRIRDRISTLKKQQTQTSKQIKIGSVEVLDNVVDNRIQIFFDGKPSDETRTYLKQHGFKWAPSVGAWQRYRDDYRFRQVVDYLAKSPYASEPSLLEKMKQRKAEKAAASKPSPHTHSTAKKAAYVAAYGKRHRAYERAEASKHPFGLTPRQHRTYSGHIDGSEKWEYGRDPDDSYDFIDEMNEQEARAMGIMQKPRAQVKKPAPRKETLKKPAAKRKPKAPAKKVRTPAKKPATRKQAVPKKPVSKPIGRPQVLKASTKQIGRSNTKWDKVRTAMAPGKRKSATGRIYYEYRKNRSDVRGRRV